MSYMFNYASGFISHDLSEWEVSNVTSYTEFMTGAGAGNTEPSWIAP